MLSIPCHVSSSDGSEKDEVFTLLDVFSECKYAQQTYSYERDGLCECAICQAEDCHNVASMTRTVRKAEAHTEDMKVHRPKDYAFQQAVRQMKLDTPASEMERIHFEIYGMTPKERMALLN